MAIPITIENGIIVKPGLNPDVCLYSSATFNDERFTGRFALGSAHQASPVYMHPAEIVIGEWQHFGSREKAIFVPDYKLRFTDPTKNNIDIDQLTSVFDALAKFCDLYKRKTVATAYNNEEDPFQRVFWELRPIQEVPQRLMWYQELKTGKRHFGIPPIQNASIANLQSNPQHQGYSILEIWMVNGDGLRPKFRYDVPTPKPEQYLEDCASLAKSNELEIKIGEEAGSVRFSNGQ